MTMTGSVAPKHIRYYSDALRVNVRSTVAFQATCRCGWKGSWRNKRTDASDDYQEHKMTEHGSTD